MSEPDVGEARTALVTGASRGIGRAIAVALAARGVRIAVHYHSNETAAEETRRQLAGHGHLPCSADLTDAAAAARLWSEVIAAFGRIDILVNNAGLFIDHPPLATAFDTWVAAWRITLATNLIGPANLSVLAAQTMAAQPPGGDAFGRGRIVNISSRGAFRGEPDAPAYGASKAAVGSLTKTLAVEWSRYGVTVNAIAPGIFRTDINTHLLDGTDRGRDFLIRTPMGRFGKVEELVSSAVFLASPSASFISGEILAVDGGFLASGVNR